LQRFTIFSMVFSLAFIFIHPFSHGRLPQDKFNEILIIPEVSRKYKAFSQPKSCAILTLQ